MINTYWQIQNLSLEQNRKTKIFFHYISINTTKWRQCCSENTVKLITYEIVSSIYLISFSFSEIVIFWLVEYVKCWKKNYLIQRHLGHIASKAYLTRNKRIINFLSSCLTDSCFCCFLFFKSFSWKSAFDLGITAIKIEFLYFVSINTDRNFCNFNYLTWGHSAKLVNN